MYMYICICTNDLLKYVNSMKTYMYASVKPEEMKRDMKTNR